MPSDSSESPTPHPNSRPTRRSFLRQAGTGLGASLTLGTTAHAATSTPPPPPPVFNLNQVGSLFPFIASQAVKQEFPLSYLQPQFQSLPDWKKTARTKLLDLLHYSPPPCDPRAEVIERTDRGDYLLERILFNTTPDLRIPACVLIPKHAPLPAPAIIALHDHGGFYLWGKEKLLENKDEHPVLTDFKKTFYAGRSIAADLVRQGYVVIVIDMFYWGERRLLLDDDADDWRHRPRDISAERIRLFNQRSGQSEYLLGRTILAAGFTWSGVMFWDDIRTVDYLLTRKDVDPSRIGCVGLSIGGLRACHLAALDDRIKASVIVGWMASFPRQLQRHVRSAIGFTKLVPGLYRHLDYPDVASLAMPTPLLVINGKRDGLFDQPGVQECYAKLAACYQKAGIPAKFRGLHYDTPHEFNLEMQTQAWEWLAKWVKA